MKRSATRAPKGSLIVTSCVMVCVGLVAVACTVEPQPLVSSDIRPPPRGDAGPGKDAAQPTDECSNTATPASQVPTDPSTLPKCACANGGAARCVPKANLPAGLASQLEACTEGGEGACVPDKLVKSGGAAPTTCESAFGEGRCMDICIPEIGKNAAILTRGTGDICGEQERCAPCLNPLKNNEPSGVCEIGKAPAVECVQTKSAPPPVDPAATTTVTCPHTGAPIIDPTTFPPCGDGAHCIPEAVAGAGAAQLKKCSGGGVCAPDKSIAAAGQYLPKTCKSLASAEGRCINLAVPAVAAQKAQLPKDTCDANELCAPCFDPTNAKETGVCRTVSCDAPKQPAVTFKPCCLSKGVSRAKCVPSSFVPAAQQDTLDDDDETCVEGKELCVPNEMLQPTYKGGVPCEAKAIQGKYTGVCMSDCLHFSFFQKLGTDQGNCQNEYTCVPCTMSGKPTGAPGCPP